MTAPVESYRGAVLRRCDIRDSPLWAAADRHSLWGRVVTDPREIETIRLRVAWYAQPWWRRIWRGPRG